MIKVLIVEDEEIAARQLERLLKKCDDIISVSTVCSTVKKAIEVINGKEEIDLIFLDIHLADGIVFDLFKNETPKAAVVFVTAYDTYAVKAFELNSLDYLLKPVRLERLKESIFRYKQAKENNQFFLNGNFAEMMRVLSKNKEHFKDRFLVKGGSKLLSVEIDEISYFIRDSDVIKLVLKTGKTFAIKYSIEDLEKSLDPQQFFRLNRQVLASHSALHQIHTYFRGKLKVNLTPPADCEILISQERSTAFKLWLDGEK